MPRPLSRSVEHVITHYDDTVRAVRSRVTEFVDATWTDLGNYRDADIDRFVARVVPVVTGGQRQVASLTDAYLAAIETSVLGVPTRPRGVPASVISTDAVRGLSAAKVYRRPGVTVWTALANGVALDDAVNRGLTRALSLATTDLQLARTHATRYLFTNNDNIRGYRRVVGGAEPCALCELAADNYYSRGDLLPIHPGCSCGVEPDFDGRPAPADDVTDADAGTPEPADDRFDTSDPSDADVVVHEHGELGPVLAVAGQHFTGPDDF